MSDLECPYCGHEQDLDTSEGSWVSDSETHQIDCNDCGKTYVFTTHISYNFFAEKADCLNGSPHNFRDWRDVYIRNGKMIQDRRCKDCDFEERRKVEVPTP